MSTFASRLSIAMVVLGAVILAVGCNDDGVNVGGPTVYAEAPFSFKIAVDQQARTTLEGINGRVRIAGFAQIDSFVISGRRRVGASSIKDAEDHLDLVQVDVTGLSDEVRVRTTQPPQSSGRTYLVDYELQVPNDVVIHVENVNGEIDVLSMQDSLSIKGANGDVTLRNIEASVMVATANGRVTADVTLPMHGTVDLSTANGNVSLTTPATTSANLTATVVNGRIELHGLELHEPEIRPSSLSGRLGNGEGTITLRTVNGNISVWGD